ncbi:MAG: T9SS type A sorting domain-containing protein [Bacteroidota bacterium]
MKKIAFIFLSFVWLCNLHSQTWVSVIDSMPNSRPFIFDAEVDTVNNLLYIAGDFQHINDIWSNAVVKYDGVKFDSLGAGVDPQWKGMNTSMIKRIKMFQNKLYVAGQFQRAGKYYSPNLARWNGIDWDTTNFTFKDGTYDGTAIALDVYNNELYVGGQFDSIGGLKCNNFAKYDGTNWHSLSYPFNTCVAGMANYKGKLFMAGQVSGNSSCANLAYYDGINWNPWAGVYGSATKSVFGMKVIDSMLFVYGRFVSIGGTNCSGLAAWNGTRWYGYGKGVSTDWTIFDIAKVNGDLYITGTFDSINDLSTSNGMLNFYTNIAKFDLTTNRWCTFMEPIGGGLNFSIEYNNELYFGGAYLEIGNNTPAMPLTKWIGGSTSVNCGAIVDVGVKEYDDVFHFTVYPNPTTGYININDEENLLQNANIEIKNNLGQVVYSRPFNSQIDLSHFSSGMYYLTINALYSKTVKVIKQ